MTPFRIPDYFRIYCVVATTVQVPLELQVVSASGASRLRRLTVTQSITQPPGRVAAQVGHVTSRMRDWMLRQYLRFERPRRDDAFWNSYCPDVTTIVLGARDSFELNHVEQLLKSSGIPVHGFDDSNKEYGIDNDGRPMSVMTAIATEPVHPNDVIGVLDYLPAWDLPK